MWIGLEPHAKQIIISKLKSVQSIKYLGVTLQTDGEFDLHISEVAKNGNKLKFN